MKILVRVRNSVTIIATLPGKADNGIIRLKKDIATIIEEGKKYR